MESSSSLSSAPDPESGQLRTYADEVALSELLSPIRRNWWVIPLCMVLFTALGVAFVKRQPVLYAAEMTVMPSRNGGEFGSSEGLTEGLAQSLLSGGKGGDSNPDFQLFQATIGSLPLARILQNKYGLLQRFYEEQWDPVTETWREPQLGLRGRLERTLLEWFGVPYYTKPSLRSLAASVKEMVTFEEVENSPLFRVQLVTEDPEWSVELLKIIYEETNEYLRQRRVVQLEERLKFLNSQAQRVSVLLHREALTSMIASTGMELTLMKSGTPFAAEVVDPPTLNPVPVSPQIKVTLLITVAAGFCFGVMATYLLALAPPFRRRRGAETR